MKLAGATQVVTIMSGEHESQQFESQHWSCNNDNNDHISL